MADFTNLVSSMKTAAVDAVEAGKPCGAYFGTVTSVQPLEISMDSQTPLTTAQLVLTRNVTDYEVEMHVDHQTETASDHIHEYKGRKKFAIRNGLAVGDKVVLLRVQGGQKYIVWDRIA